MAELKELLPPGGSRVAPAAAVSTGVESLDALDYAATQVGVVGKITVMYDPALGPKGLALAQEMLGAVSAPYGDMETFFGITGSAVTVVIAPLSGSNDGTGGAYHYGCDFTSGGILYLDATFATTTVDPFQLEVGLYIAELSEAFMGAQNKGWGCGFSNGEGLSRYLAEYETVTGTLDIYETGPDWAQSGFADWVNTTEQTDRESISTGCAVVYIYWMRSLGFTVEQIVQAGGGTLSANYQSLTGKTTAYQDLRAALTNVQVTSDDPFDGGRGVLAWKGVNTDQRLFYNVNRSGASWTNQAQIPGTGGSSHEPALAAFGGRVYLAWKGVNADQRLFVNSSGGGAHWTNQEQVPNTGGTSHGPALAAFNGRLYLAWKGEGDDQRLFFNSTADGTNWTFQAQVPETGGTSHGPALTAFNGRLYLAWKGEGTDQRLFFNSTADGTTWTNQAQVPETGGSSNGPTLAVFGGRLYLAWKGVNADQRLFFNSTADGTTWTNQAQVPQTGGSSDGPSLAAFDGRLLLAWKGEGTDQRLFASSTGDGATWTNQAQVQGTGGSSARPALAPRV